MKRWNLKIKEIDIYDVEIELIVVNVDMTFGWKRERSKRMKGGSQTVRGKQRKREMEG